MAGNIEPKYGTGNQSVTCTITSLANNGQRQSTFVDNSTNLYADAFVFVKVKTSASALTAPSIVNVYAYGSDGTTFGDTVTGTDGSVTLTSPPNLRQIGVVNCPAISTTYIGEFTVAAAFGGRGNLPFHWGVVIENKTGQTLDASVGAVTYQGIQDQYT